MSATDGGLLPAHSEGVDGLQAGDGHEGPSSPVKQDEGVRKEGGDLEENNDAPFFPAQHNMSGPNGHFVPKLEGGGESGDVSDDSQEGVAGEQKPQVDEETKAGAAIVAKQEPEQQQQSQVQPNDSAGEQPHPHAQPDPSGSASADQPTHPFDNNGVHEHSEPQSGLPSNEQQQQQPPQQLSQLDDSHQPTNDGNTADVSLGASSASSNPSSQLNGDASTGNTTGSSAPADSSAATAYEFLPFFPAGSSDMNRLAEAWQQNQQHFDPTAANGIKQDAGEPSSILDHNGHSGEQHGTSNDHQHHHQQQPFTLDSLVPNGQQQQHEQHSNTDNGDAGLLLNMAAESNATNVSQAQQHATQHQQVQQALANHAAFSQVPSPTTSHGYGHHTPNGGFASPGSSHTAAVAAAAAAAQGHSPAYAIAAALAATGQGQHEGGQGPWDKQEGGQGQWDMSAVASFSPATPYSNPQYAPNIAAYNQQQQQQQQQSHGQHGLSHHQAQQLQASTSANTVGGHTHRPGSGHAFCTGPFVEGTEIRRFVFPLGQDVSAGRKKHVRSAQEMADTFPLAHESCERCRGYDNPLPCFHKEGSKCVYCKFLSKPCSLQPGGTNNKERRADGTSMTGPIGSAKKKRKGNSEGEVFAQHGGLPNHTGPSTSAGTSSMPAGLATVNSHHHQQQQQQPPFHPSAHHLSYSLPASGTVTPTNGDHTHSHNHGGSHGPASAQDLAAAAQHHQEQLQAQAQAQAQAQVIRQVAEAHHQQQQQQQQQQAVAAALASQPPSHASTPQPQAQPQTTL